MSGFGYLVTQITFCLVLAAALGFLIGWLWRALLADRDAVQRDRDWSARLDRSESSRRDLEDRLSTSEEEHAQALSQREESLAALAADLEVRTKERDASSQEFAKEHEKLNRLSADTEQLRSDLASARDLANGHEERLTASKAELAKLNDKAEAGSRQIQELKSNLQAAEQRFQEGQQRFKEIEQRAGDTEQMAKDAEQKAKDAEQRLDGKVTVEAQLREELGLLAGRNNASEQAKIAAEGELESLRGKLGICQDSVSRIKAEAEALRSELAASREANASGRQTEAESAAALQAAKADHTRREEDAARRIAELESELTDCLNARPSEPVPAQALVGGAVGAVGAVGAAAQLEAQIAERDAQILQLKQDLAAMDKLAGEALEPDDLQRIRGIGPVLEKLLNGAGVFTFRQIAAWDAADIAWAAAKLDAFTDRIERDQWVAQAHAFYREKLAHNR